METVVRKKNAGGILSQSAPTIHFQHIRGEKPTFEAPGVTPENCLDTGRRTVGVVGRCPGARYGVPAGRDPDAVAPIP